ncbi:MAG: metallophosphatase domain-containing protein [Sandaracinaceae bacterium]
MTVRIVAVSDTHTFQSELGPVPDGDLFIHAGDLLRGGSLDELEPVADWLGALPHRHKIVIAGNHDGCFQEDRMRAEAMFRGRVTYLQDSGCTVLGLQLWGSPWQPAYNDWAFNLPRGEALAQRWAHIPVETDVLITHGPPHGHGDRGPVPGRQGCVDLRARVDVVAPRLHLFGHIHQDGGVWDDGRTAFANVTTWECERAPTVLDLDVKTGALRPVHVPPARVASVLPG